MNNRPAPSVWRWPVALGVGMAAGLVAALFSDGWADALAWLGLGVPLAVAAWHSLRPIGHAP